MITIHVVEKNQQTFDTQKAKSTIKIQWVQDGRIEDSFDFSEKNQKFEIRIQSFLKKKLPTYEKLGFENSQREYIQIQDKIYQNYEMVSYPLPIEVINIIFFQISLANEIYITDYNYAGLGPLYFKSVSLVSIDNIISYNENKKAFLTLSFTDKNKTSIKRNNRIK